LAQETRPRRRRAVPPRAMPPVNRGRRSAVPRAETRCPLRAPPVLPVALLVALVLPRAALGGRPTFVSNCRPGDEVIALSQYRGAEIWLDAIIERVASYDEVHVQYTDRRTQDYRCPRPPPKPGSSAGADVHENCIFPNEKVLRQCLCDAHNKPCSEWVTPPVEGSEAEIVVAPKQPRPAPAGSKRVLNLYVPSVLLFFCIVAVSCAYLALRWRVQPEPTEAQVLPSPVAPLGFMREVVNVISPANKAKQVRMAKLRAAAMPSPTAFPARREKAKVAWPARAEPLYKDRPHRPGRIGGDSAAGSV